MNPTFEVLYRLMGRATAGLLVVVLALYGLALAFALVGFRHAAESLSQAGLAFAIIFLVLFVLFIVISLAAAALRWLDSRCNPPA